MIEIITGEINTGKSTRLKKDFSAHSGADGFVCSKFFVDDVHAGYDLVHLPTNDSCAFIRKVEFMPDCWNEATRIMDNFTFSKEGFEFAKKIADNAILNNISRFYIDEIGHLELNGEGFYNMVNKLLTVPNLTLVFIVRRRLLEQTIALFKIKDYIIIKQET